VRISGVLDLEAATFRCPLSLEGCYLDAGEPVCLDHATVPQLALTWCVLASLTGQMLSTREVDLRFSVLTGGPLLIRGADITGQLICRGAQLTSADSNGYALRAEGMKVGEDVFLDLGFTAAGAVWLLGADITGQLNCGGAQLTGKDSDGTALFAEAMKVGGAVFLDRGFTAAGTVRLSGADIGSQLNCTGAQLAGKDREGNALVAEAMKVGGAVFLDGVSTEAGAIRLLHTDITSQLNCTGAQLTGKDNEGYALDAERMKIDGNVLLCSGFTAEGAVSLYGADITGQLNCRGAELTGKDSEGDTLVAERMKVGGAVILDEGFTAAGAVRLLGADITGQLNCGGAELTGKGNHGRTLVADGVNAGGDVFLDKGFTAAGTVSLRSARISGSVVLHPAALAGRDQVALNAAGAQIAGALLWSPAGQIVGQVNLEGATIGELADDWPRGRPDGYWPVRGQLRLEGFTYDRLGGKHQATVEERLSWIDSQYHGDNPAAFATQPYEQLAAVYRQAGQDSQARKVAIARRADLRKYGKLNPYRKAGNWLLDKTIKYGYQSWRAGVMLAFLFAIFWGLTILAEQHHLIAWSGDVSGLPFEPSTSKCTSAYPCFYPFGYTVDTVIPLINVHQADYWGPDASTPWGLAFQVVTWIATGIGWALATLLVAGFTGLVRRD
jgi:hypothetical protein